ncbi:MAG: APC family permease [Dehalococcoidia bacterium]
MEDQQRPRSFFRRPRQAPGDVEPDSATPPVGATTPTPKDPPEATPTPTPEPTPQERERIVVPRQDRGSRYSGLELELREVRYGATSRSPYLRVVPGQRRFERSAPHVITATRQASRPTGRLEAALHRVKGVVLGSPLAVAQAAHERLTKLKALAILGSDPLSSSAYATQEALIILAVAGMAGLDYLIPIGVAVAALLVLVTVSYRQTIKAYPNGGGAYTVSHDNLGRLPGLVAAGALMVDYTLLVSVSVAAGVAAITSAAPGLLDYRVPMSIAIIVAFVFGNLRGTRESGTLFAAPTYFFIVMMAGTIAYGVVRVIVGDAPGSLTEAAPPDHPERLEELATGGVTLWLVLRAFSSGASALTGVEAMANGVPSFKKPEADNARQTMVAMAAIGVFLFLGITFLSSRFGLVPNEEETLVSDMGRTILGQNALYYAFQAGTAMILFLAANTSFNAFPLLSAILSRDRYMPRQFAFRGDRLAYSNGILLLAVIAIVLLVVYDAQVTKLIPLYAVGVFIAFTLSQAGMVKHWWLHREQGWQGSIALNFVGLVATGIVAVIIGATKFLPGAWISLVMVGVLVTLFLLIRRHYDWYERVVAISEDEASRGVPGASPREAARDHVIVPIDGLNHVSIGAIGMARAISANVTAVHLTGDLEAAELFRRQWERVAPDVPLLIIDSPYRAFAAPMMAYMELLERTEPDKRITVILPGFKAHHWWERLLHNQAVRRLRPLLEVDERVTVVDFDYDVDRNSIDDPRGSTPTSV